MLDPGRYFAEAIYFLQYTLAQILWAIGRATLSIAIITESVNDWLTAHVAYLVQLLVNALSAPLGGIFILALTALGVWYGLNNIVPTNRWVDPAKLLTYGFLAFFFFSAPVVAIEMMEDVRVALNSGFDGAILTEATGDLFTSEMDGTDTGLPGALPDVNSDGVLTSFDLVSAFMAVGHLDELDSSEFPAAFEATYFPFGDPAGIDLSDEADQEAAKALASDGIERLFFALVAIPTAVAEHFLRLALTGVAVLLYAGMPIAMVLAFFIHTQALLGAYVRQLINLLIETFLSLVIVALMVRLLMAAAEEGIGLYIGASLLTLLVLVWRIQGAMKLGSAAMDLFGGSLVTGGVGGMGLARLGQQAVMGTAAVAGAAVTGGATLAAGGALMGAAAALRADGNREGAYLGSDPAKSEGRVRQLQAMAGYTLGRSERVRQTIESAHEVRTLGRSFRDGAAVAQTPDTLDYLRAGSSLSGVGSHPWLALRTSPALRTAYDQIGGRIGYVGTRPAVSSPLSAAATAGAVADGRGGSRGTDWRSEPATAAQLGYLRQMGVEPSAGLSRGAASDLLAQRRTAQRATTAGDDRLPPELLHRFAHLEQALEALVEALRTPETAVAQQREEWAGGADERVRAGQSRIRRRVSRAGDETVNGPLPEWLREEAAVEDSTPISTAVGTPTEPQTSAGATSAALAYGRGQVRLEPLSPERRQTFDELVSRLAEPETPGGAAAYRMLRHDAGARNAALLQTAVAEQGATAVQETATAVAGLSARYEAAGMSDEAQLTAFQDGTALAALRAETETPLTDDQVTAVADLVLRPQRYLPRAELAAVIGQEAATGAGDEQAVVAALGMPIGFGGQTGVVRGVLAGAQEMNLSPLELARLAEMIEEGVREQVLAELTRRGQRPEQACQLVTDLAALPGALVVPQSTGIRPTGGGATGMNLTGEEWPSD
jgi:hypothetical protein